MSLKRQNTRCKYAFNEKHSKGHVMISANTIIQMICLSSYVKHQNCVTRCCVTDSSYVAEFSSILIQMPFLLLELGNCLPLWCFRKKNKIAITSNVQIHVLEKDSTIPQSVNQSINQSNALLLCLIVHTTLPNQNTCMSD